MRAIDRLVFPLENTFDNDELRLILFFFFCEPVDASLTFKDLSDVAFLFSINCINGVRELEQSWLLSLLLFGVLVGTANKSLISFG